MTSATTRRVNDVTIVDLRGRFGLIGPPPVMVEEVDRLVRRGETKIILNFKSTKGWDEIDWGPLFRAYTTAWNAGAQIRLLNLNRQQLKLFPEMKAKCHDIVETHPDFLQVYRDECAAVSSFGP